MAYKKRLPVIIAVGDIRGFSIWEQQLINPETEFTPFMNSFDKMIDEFELHTGYFTKKLGDGILIILELENNENRRKATYFLGQTWNFLKNVQKMMDECESCPKKIRMRSTFGDAWKRESSTGIDYVGRHINRAFKLLRVNPEIPYICHESVRSIVMSSKNPYHNFKFTRFIAERRIPDGLTKEDMVRLYRVDIKKK